ncbi:unnamed protein product [Prunus brigantina]
MSGRTERKREPYLEVRDRREDLELGLGSGLGPAGNKRDDDVHSVDDTDGHHLFDCLSDSLSRPRREVTCDDDYPKDGADDDPENSADVDPENSADVDPRDEADTEVHLLVASVSLRRESRFRKD